MEKVKKVKLKYSYIFVNLLIGISIILAVGLMAIILFFEKKSFEKFVTLYIFSILVITLLTIILEQILERKGKTKIFYKKFGICGFLYCVFIESEMCSLMVYWFLTRGILQEKKEGIYFSLYIGICVGTFLWFVYHLGKKNTDYNALQMILQPFVLIVTIWGYVIDKFGIYKNYAIFLVALVLTISFLINLVGYAKEQKKRKVSIIIEKTGGGYDVILNDETRESCQYRVIPKE